MKKSLPLLMIVFCTMFIASIQAAQPQDVKVIANGEEVLFPDQKPVIQNGRTLVPVRGVFEKIGFTVTWDNKTNTATLKDSNYEIKIKSGEASFLSNGTVITPDVPQQSINGRLMLPLKAVSESIGAQVEWDGNNRIVTVNYGNNTTPKDYYTGVLPDGTTLSIFESKDSIISKLGEPDSVGDKWDAYDKHGGARGEMIISRDEWSALSSEARETTRVYAAKDGYSVLYYSIKLGMKGFIVLDDKNQAVKIFAAIEGYQYMDITTGQAYPIESSFRPLIVDYNGVYESFVRPTLSDMPLLYIEYRSDRDKIGGKILAIIQPDESINVQPETQMVSKISLAFNPND